jgi:streptogramin lyase
MRFLPVVAFVSFALTGCSLTRTATPGAATGYAIQGKVHGGEQPIAGAKVYLLAANTVGYGAASVSLLDAAAGRSNSTGAYVLTAADGSFSITGDYLCTAGQQVYLYALGGNPGGGVNSASGLLAILGDCPGPTFSSSTFIWLNEVSTVAAAYAIAGFAVDPTHVSSSGTALAQTGIANAFANAANLASLSTGVALTTTPAGNGTVPQAEIDTLANILAACVNSTGPSSATCAALFSDAKSSGTSGTKPTDTAAAAINIAHNPGANVAALFDILPTASPFAPTLATQPNDFTLALTFTGGGLNYPNGLAIDANGNAWVANAYGDDISEFSPLGAALSPAAGIGGIGGLSNPQYVSVDQTGDIWIDNPPNNGITELYNSGAAISPVAGYSGGGMAHPLGIAIDNYGYAWTVNSTSSSASQLDPTGHPVSPPAGYTGGGIASPTALAIDGSGNVWIANNISSVSELSNNGTPISPTGGYTGGGLLGPSAIALDDDGAVWVANLNGNSITLLANNGIPISSTDGYTGGGLSYPVALALDGNGSPWLANYDGNSITHLSNTGAAISPSTGFTANLSGPIAIAIDSSGNAWTANHFAATVTEFIGIATPVITPIAAGLPAVPTTDGSSTLATRP